MSFGQDGYSLAYLHPELLELRNPDNAIRRRWGDGKRAVLPSYADETDVPLVRWFAELLAPLQSICLSGEALRRPNPPSRVNGPGRDGGNLANFLHHFRKDEPKRYRLWLRHLREALPEIEDVRTRERPEDRHRCVVVHYRNGLQAPSWIVSEGTLRMLALTCLAYAPPFGGVCVIEGLENGIHPTALETVIQSLSSTYDCQVLLATHSPLIATLVEPEDILCFRHTPEEGTTVLGGHEHPRLQGWQGTADRERCWQAASCDPRPRRLKSLTRTSKRRCPGCSRVRGHRVSADTAEPLESLIESLSPGISYRGLNSGIEQDSCSSHSTSTGMPQVTASTSAPTTFDSRRGPSSRSTQATT